MNVLEMKTNIKQYFVFYLTGFLMVLGIKYFYSKAGSDELIWILAPTARLVSVLSGIPFFYEANVGYVNHELRFIIAPSCSGVQFMTICIAMLIFSFLHRAGAPQGALPGGRSRRTKKCLGFMAASVGLSYLLTVFVNSLRIVLSIYLPNFFRDRGLYGSFLTPEKLHTIIGTAVYFVSLLTVYRAAGYISQKIYAPRNKDILTDGRDTNLQDSDAYPDRTACGSAQETGTEKGRTSIQIICRCLPPVFWYFFIVLGIPFLNGAYRNNHEGFGAYAMLITFVCAAILCLFRLTAPIRRLLSHSIRRGRDSILRSKT